jgi:hypothetical protein
MNVPWPQHTAITKLPRLVKNLPDEFPSRTEDKNKRLGLISTLKSRFRTRGFELECFSKQFGKNGDKKRSSLARAYMLDNGGVRWDPFEHKQAYPPRK